MAKRIHEQRTILQADEAPQPGFIQNFRTSSGLAQSLAHERKNFAVGQLEFLNKSQQQRAYVDEARKQPRKPNDALTVNQELLSELRRDATTSVSKTVDPTKPDTGERKAKREAFLQSRKARHDEACDVFERHMDGLAGECQVKVQQASKTMKAVMQEMDDIINSLLHPLEVETDSLGEKTEDDIRQVMVELDAVVERKRDQIENFCEELYQVDEERKDASQKLMLELVEQMAAAAHVVQGEVERIIEVKTLRLNTALLENQRAVKSLSAKLMVQTLEGSKENKVRWHKGMLLWKQKRHRHTVDFVLERLRGNEFRHPASLVAIMIRMRQRQAEVFQKRKALVVEFFSTPVADLTTSMVRHWEEQNNSLNDRTQEAYDNLFTELKEMSDSVSDSGEAMLNELCQELEVYDARQEWGEHQCVTDLIDADIRPLLKDCLDFVKALVVSATEVLQHQEDTQHNVVAKMASFFLALAKKEEQLRKQIDEFEMNFQGEIEDCEHEHEELCNVNEDKMKGLHGDIDDAAHHEELEEFKQKTFDQLDEMAGQYREHAENVTGIYQRYPGEVAKFLEEQVQGFSCELGLITRATKEKPPEGAEGDDATLKPKTPRGDSGDSGPPLWERATRSRIDVLEEFDVDMLRQKILIHGGLSNVVAASAGNPEGAGGDVPAGDEGEDADENEKEKELPKFSDGTPVLEDLSFEAEWLVEKLDGVRGSAFQNLGNCREHLDRIDITGCTEKVSRDLDQRLRRHTNRKGEVQVEWYVPRSGIIAKHKDKFERHLIDVAQKSQGHDKSVVEFLEDMTVKEAAYQEKLVLLRDRLGEAETLPMLTSLERQAIDIANAFLEAGKHIKGNVLHLATRVPQGLQRDNENFLMMCRGGAEQYSDTETKFYSGEMEELNRALDEKSQTRNEQARNLEAELDAKKEGPFVEFMKFYAEAVELLCASKGYGRKYGEPRRKAQERCRTLISRAATVNQNILTLMAYFVSLCKKQIEEVLEEGIVCLPKCPLLRLQDFFQRTGDPWVFSSECLGAFYVLVCTLNALSSHLEAIKQPQASKYSLQAVPAVCVLRETQTLCDDAEGGAEEDSELRSAEKALREDCMVRTLGPVLKAESFNAEIESIVKASNDIYSGKGGLPDFMTKFLGDMRASAERSRQEAALAVRDQCDELRNSTLLQLGDATFGELSARSILELRKEAGKAQSVMAASWEEFDAQRIAHEWRLSPSLSNPNAEAQLRALVEDEADRERKAIAANAKARVTMVAVLRDQADLFNRRLQATFEAITSLVDSLPLHSHFANLPGDEQVEPARMSIKRRLRRLKAETEVQGDALPERSWEGFPRWELRTMMRGGEWPAPTAADGQVEDATEENLSELTPGVKSFRSPVHKKLFERRNNYYEQFKAQFKMEVRHRNSELTGREEKELTGKRNWKFMVHQLKAESSGIDDDEEKAKAEALAAAEAEAAEAAAAEAAAHAKPGKKK